MSTDRFRETRKWQLAYRRFVIEGIPGEKYAPYFGLNRDGLREWFELQFTAELSWDNFGTHWQFEHIIPLSYFNFELEQDLLLCWNFINIRVQEKGIRQEGMEADGRRHEGMEGSWQVDTLGAKQYFKTMYKNTGFSVAEKMVHKIERIESSMATIMPPQHDFIQQKKDWLENIASLNKEEFLRFNGGMPVKDLLIEREILKKFG